MGHMPDGLVACCVVEYNSELIVLCVHRLEKFSLRFTTTVDYPRGRISHNASATKTAVLESARPFADPRVLRGQTCACADSLG